MEAVLVYGMVGSDTCFGGGAWLGTCVCVSLAAAEYVLGGGYEKKLAAGS